MRLRAERVERSFAHCYETGGMRRTHLKGRVNILKRLLIHVGAFNLSLAMRSKLGAGTPRGLAQANKEAEGLVNGFHAALARVSKALATIFRRVGARLPDCGLAPPAPLLALAA